MATVFRVVEDTKSVDSPRNRFVSDDLMYDDLTEEGYCSRELTVFIDTDTRPRKHLGRRA